MKQVQVSSDKTTFTFELRRSNGSLFIKRNGVEHKVDLSRLTNNRYSLIIGGRSFEVGARYNDGGYEISNGTQSGFFEVEDYELARMKLAAGIKDSRRDAIVKAPMPGLIVSVQCQPGDDVAKGDSLVVMEAMKMENDIKSPAAGKIKSVSIIPGQSVEKGQAMVEFV